MFVVVPIKDVITVAPDSLHLDHYAAVYREVDSRYAGRVLHDYGIAVGVYDIPRIGAAELKQGLKGSAEIAVVIRLIVFQPLVGEVMLATVVNSTSESLLVSIPFADVPIVIPAHALQPTSEWDAKTSRWVWHYSDEDGDPSDAEKNVSLLPYAHGSTIRIRITGVAFEASPSTVSPGERIARLANRAAGEPYVRDHLPSTGNVSPVPFPHIRLPL